MSKLPNEQKKDQNEVKLSNEQKKIRKWILESARLLELYGSSDVFLKKAEELKKELEEKVGRPIDYDDNIEKIIPQIMLFQLLKPGYVKHAEWMNKYWDYIVEEGWEVKNVVYAKKGHEKHLRGDGFI